MNNIMKLFFLTSNKAKVKTMKRWLTSIGVKVYLRRPPINQPERKDESIERIATFKIMDNKDYIKSHFVVHDSGFYLDAIYQHDWNNGELELRWPNRLEVIGNIYENLELLEVNNATNR